MKIFTANLSLITLQNGVTLVSCNRICSSGAGTTNHDIVGTDLLGSSRSHKALLISHIAVSKTDTMSNGQEVFAATAVNLTGFQCRADNTVQTGILGRLIVVHPPIISRIYCY